MVLTVFNKLFSTCGCYIGNFDEIMSSNEPKNELLKNGPFSTQRILNMIEMDCLSIVFINFEVPR